MKSALISCWRQCLRVPSRQVPSPVRCVRLRPLIGASGFWGQTDARAVVCNAGNANAFTGRAGDIATAETAAAVSQVLGIAPESVYRPPPE